MCKANKKRWSDYRESDRCQLYLDALSQTTEIPVFDLIQSRQGHGGGTWVRPQVAVDLARWISAPFAVWMDAWFLEELDPAPGSRNRGSASLTAISEWGFWFGTHYIRLVRGFTTEAGTTEDIGFVATDLAKALEIQRTNDLTSRLDTDQKGTDQIRTPGGLQSLTVISESGFYDVVVRSDKPQGKALRNLVTREILPQLAAWPLTPAGGQTTPKRSNGLQRRGLRRAASRGSGRAEIRELGGEKSQFWVAQFRSELYARRLQFPPLGVVVCPSGSALK
jgi:hypothetical protein